MQFKDKYAITEGEFFEVKDKKGKVIETIPKIVLSNDAYAVGDMIEKLIKKIEHARMSLL